MPRSRATWSWSRAPARAAASRSTPNNRSQHRLYTGPPSGPLHLVIKRREKGWVPYLADVDDDRVLVAELHIGTYRNRARLLVPGAAPRVLPYQPDAIMLAGDRVAFTTFRGRVVVANLASGAREADVDTGVGLGNVDVAPDGRAVADELDKLVLVAPGARATEFGAGLSAPVFAGTQIAARESTEFGDRPVVLAPGADVSRPIGVQTGQITDPDADARGVTWIGNGCLYYAPVDAPAPTEPPAGPCPRAEADFEEADQTMHGRKLLVLVTCIAAPAPGCSGTVVMRRHGKIAGRGRYSVPAGTEGVATVRLTRAAARSLRRTVRRRGDAAIAMRGFVDDGRPPERGTLFVVDRVKPSS